MFALALALACCTGGAGSMYLPARTLEVVVGRYQVNRGSKVVGLHGLLYGGRPARRAEFSLVPRHHQSLNITTNGTVSWDCSQRNVSRNVTATVEAVYKGRRSRSTLRVHVVDFPRNSCLTTAPRRLEDRCLPVKGEFGVYEDSEGPLLLLESLGGPGDLGCGPVTRRLLSGEGEVKDGGLWWRGGGKRGGGGRLVVECALQDGRRATRSYTVALLPRRVVLPYPLSQNRTLRLPSSTYTEGERAVLGSVALQKNALYSSECKQSPPNSPRFNITLTPKYFPSDPLDLTLLLVGLIWTESGSLNQSLQINIDIEVTSTLPVHISNKVEVRCVLEGGGGVAYREKSVAVSRRGTPLTRVASPALLGGGGNSSRPSSLVLFKAALPDFLESPFNVTAHGGILYLASWAHQSLPSLPANTGVLVEWKGGGEEGLAWVGVELVETGGCDAPPPPAHWRRNSGDGWTRCSELVTRDDCHKTCGVSAVSLSGRCEWREGRRTGMTANYSTCRGDAARCPDGVCDPLEKLYLVELCPQDCTEDEVMLGTKGEKGGIKEGSGVCSCDNVGKCHCGVVVAKVSTTAPPPPTPPPPATTGVKGVAREERCDASCTALLLAAGALLTLALAAAALLVLSRRRGWLAGKKEAGGSRGGGGAAAAVYYTSEALLASSLRPHVEMDPKWEIPRSRITIEGCLGEGEFGRVLKATARDLPSHPGVTTVAVKTVKESGGAAELGDLLSEYHLLKEVSHPNVVRLLGACTAPPDQPLYLVIEYCSLGSLRSYLRKSRHVKTSGTRSGEELSALAQLRVTPKDILSFSWQVAKGMAYLTEIKLVHRDLAARNVLLASGKLCKISDFGLTRDVYEDDTYLKRSRGRVPVKWMALECLSDQIYTSKSDVWSFGVVLWELVTLGSSPYPGVPAQNLYQLLKNGYRMHKPHNCSTQLYEIMCRCWSQEPPDRPSFAELVDKLERMLEEGTDYLDCNIRMVLNPGYFTTPEGEEVEVVRAESSDRIDIKFRMDFEEMEKVENGQEVKRYENEKQTPFILMEYDIPRPASKVLTSHLRT